MTQKCAISCRADSAVFDDFTKNVLLNYRARINQAKEEWTISNKGLLINPIVTSENSSKWQVYAIVQSSIMGNFDVLVFVDVERDIQLYPATFGYYIKQFNSYRITQ